MSIPCQRDRFDIPPDVTYLNCAYMAPISRATLAAGDAGLTSKLHPWSVSAPDFFTGPNRLRGQVAQLLGGRADDIALVPSVSYGVAVAAANLPLQPGQRVLVLEEAFPSMVYGWREATARAGASVVTVPRPADDDWTSAVLERIDARTAVACLPHCHWTDGGLLDLAAIGARLREAGGALVVDATQSLGALPLSVAEIQPDFLVAAAYKWLLGPYNLGFLYVHPRHHGGMPLEQTWIGREGSEDFAGLTRYRDGFQPGARRFDAGESSSFVNVPMAIAALGEILEWGVPAIQATLREATARIAEAAGPLGFTAVPPARRAGHYLGLRSARPLPPDLLGRLAAERVFVSVRGPALRVTPHLYNDAADGERFVSALGRALDG